MLCSAVDVITSSLNVRCFNLLHMKIHAPKRYIFLEHTWQLGVEDERQKIKTQLDHVVNVRM